MPVPTTNMLAKGQNVTALFQALVTIADQLAVGRNVFIALSPRYFFLPKQTHENDGERERKGREKETAQKKTSHIYWPLMCNKKKFKSHFVSETDCYQVEQQKPWLRH